MTNKELAHIAPMLSSLKDIRTGFIVPDSYFDMLESVIVSKLSENSKSEKSAFILPESYLMQKEKTFISKLEKEAITEHKEKTFISKLEKETITEHKEKKIVSNLEKEVIIEHKQKVPLDYFDTFEDRVFDRLAKEKKNKIFSINKYWISTAIAASIVLMFTIYNPFTITKNKEIEEITTWIENGNLDLDSYQIAEFYNSDLESFEIQNTISTETLENYIIDEFTEDAFYN